VWNDYFTGSATTYNSQTYRTRPTLSGTSVYVLNCLFRSITTPSNGGALFCSSVTYLLVESTSFFSCKTSSSHYGAIYFENSGGQCVLYEVCGYDCCSTYASTSYYQFAYICVKNDVSSKNYVNYSSIVRCVNMVSDSFYTLNLRCGKICCPSVNISMNKCQSHSGIYFYSSVYSNSITSSFSYTTFADNTANGYNCIFPWGGNRYIEFKSCNIIRNTQGSLSSGGTIYSLENMIIEDSCILENKADYIFYAHSNTITISNCTLDSTSRTGNVIIQNTITKSFILALNHLSTQNCHAGYDAVGTLIPIVQTPTSSKKQKLCYTFERLLLRCQQENIFSFAIIFNFINPYASGDPFH
jgi:hypothetical protein